MISRKYRLTPDISHTITAFIRAGAFPHMAAEAVGIPANVYDQWMDRGNPLNRRRGWKPHKECTPFWHAVHQATAQARVTAEVKALKEDPLRWLTQGPGKDRADACGWSQTVRPVPAQAKEVNVLLDPQMQDIFATILKALAPYPEARSAVARALAGDAKRPTTGPRS